MVEEEISRLIGIPKMETVRMLTLSARHCHIDIVLVRKDLLVDMTAAYTFVAAVLVQTTMMDILILHLNEAGELTYACHKIFDILSCFIVVGYLQVLCSVLCFYFIE